MTDDDKALVERLAAEADNFKVAREVDMRGMLYRAADRIEALSAENERLRERIERLRKALYAAYDDEPGWCDLTRAALGDTK